MVSLVLISFKVAHIKQKDKSTEILTLHSEGIYSKGRRNKTQFLPPNFSFVIFLLLLFDLCVSVQLDSPCKQPARLQTHFQHWAHTRRHGSRSDGRQRPWWRQMSAHHGRRPWKTGNERGTPPAPPFHPGQKYGCEINQSNYLHVKVDLNKT